MARAGLLRQTFWPAKVCLNLPAYIKGGPSRQKKWLFYTEKLEVWTNENDQTKPGLKYFFVVHSQPWEKFAKKREKGRSCNTPYMFP